MPDGEILHTRRVCNYASRTPCALVRFLPGFSVNDSFFHFHMHRGSQGIMHAMVAIAITTTKKSKQTEKYIKLRS